MTRTSRHGHRSRCAPHRFSSDSFDVTLLHASASGSGSCQRLARLIGLDGRDADLPAWRALAHTWRQAQLDWTAEQVNRVSRQAGLPADAPLVAAYATEFRRTQQTAQPTAASHALPVQAYYARGPASEIASWLMPSIRQPSPATTQVW